MGRGARAGMHGAMQEAKARGRPRGRHVVRQLADAGGTGSSATGETAHMQNEKRLPAEGIVLGGGRSWRSLGMARRCLAPMGKVRET